MHPFKELQKLAPKFAKQVGKTLKALSKIQDNDDPKLEAKLIAEYQEIKNATEEISKRFQELIEIDQKAKESEKNSN